MKTGLKYILINILAVAFIGIIFYGCQKKTSKITIGISKIVAHPALDAVEKGIQDKLKELGYENIHFDLQNANGEVSTASSIASKFKSDKVDLAVGIATPTAIALANTLKDIPVVYSAITDPVDAGLVSSFDKGGKNITGVSDMTPVKEQIELLTKIKKIKRLGHIYSSGEANAVTLADMAAKACKELEIKFIRTTVTNSSEVKAAAKTIIDKVDAIYVSTDNTIVSAISSVSDVAWKNNIPIISADPSSSIKAKILAAWGFDYYKMGLATGKMISEILDGKKTEDIPTRFMKKTSDVDLLINLDVAKKLGLSFPKDIQEAANKIIKDGKLTTK